MDLQKIQAEFRSRPDGFDLDIKALENYYYPLFGYFLEQKKKLKKQVLIIGIQGAQGVGKTTLTTLLQLLFEASGHIVAGCSIDDFYLSLADREALSKQYPGNPFYRQRGMPGTHYHGKLFATLERIRAGEPFGLPVFDKSLYGGRGDVTAEVREFANPLDCFILEGWCVNLPYTSPDTFIRTIRKNACVEQVLKELDPELQHVQVVLDYLKAYEKCWALLDLRTVLMGPDIRWVEEWRAEQETQLIARKGSGMTLEQVRAFVRPYIPFTYFYAAHVLQYPESIDALLEVDRNHLPAAMRIR